MKNKEKIETNAAIERLRQTTGKMIAAWGRPKNVFTLDRKRAALVVIDMQNFVLAPQAGPGIPGTDLVVGNTNRLVDTCHELSIPVIWVRQNIDTAGKKNNGGLYPVFHDPNHLKSIENQRPGTEIYTAMHYDVSKDYVVFKKRYSAFLPAPSPLQQQLLSLKKTQLIIAGVASNVCVESTVRDAMQLGYEVIVARDATTSFDDLVNEVTLMNIRLFFGDVRSCQSVVEELIR